mgnify:CR=1 FL=1
MTVCFWLTARARSPWLIGFGLPSLSLKFCRACWRTLPSSIETVAGGATSFCSHLEDQRDWEVSGPARRAHVAVELCDLGVVGPGDGLVGDACK